MKKVLIHGYTMDNLGDDLFFRVLVKRYPHVQFYLPTLNIHYKEKFKDLKNLKVIDFFGVSRFTQHQIYKLPKLYSQLHMKKMDAVVCIGGSLFIDRKNPTANDRIEAENYSFICDWESAKKNNVPYFVIGANWGPCYNDYFYDYFNRAFDSLYDLCFRETYSYELFKDKKCVRHSGDILMGNQYIRDITNDCVKRKQVAISVVDVNFKKESGANAQDYENKLSLIIDELILKGYDIKLLSFCKSEGDEDVINRITSKITDRSRVELLCYHDNFEDMLKCMGESEFLIASRFHATVLGWSVGTPVFSMTYSDKTVNIIKNAGFDYGYIQIKDINSLSLDDIFNNLICPQNIDKLSGESAFLKLDDLLAKEGGR